MKLYLLTTNTHMDDDSREIFPHFEVVGVFDELEKAKLAKEKYAIEITADVLDKSIEDKELLVKQDEHEAATDTFFIDEVDLNQEYRDKKLDFESL